MSFETPLAETIARISHLEVAGAKLSVRLGLPGEPGWTSAAALAGDDALLDELLGRVGDTCGSADRAVTGALFLRSYLWRMLLPVVAAFLIDRRVPDVGAENVALRFDGYGGAADLALVGSRSAALGSDPAAGMADAVIVRGEDEMLAWLKEGLTEAHLPELFSALRHCGVRRAERALWGMVSDLIAEAFAWVGPALGVEDEARGFAHTMLDGSPPIRGSANFFAMEHDGGSVATRVRNACCLYYRVGALACLTCPRTTREERLRRLTAG